MRFNLLTALLFSVIIIDISGAQQFKDTPLIIANSDGTLSISWSAVSNGKKDSKGNFFYSTLSPDNITGFMGSFVFYEVKMGVFTDYLIPALLPGGALQTYTPFMVLGGGTRSDAGNLRCHTYSPVNPLDDSFDGTSTPIENDGPTIYGSSPKGFVHNGNRNYLSGWGDTGCCFERLNDTFGWNRGYTITAHKFPTNFVYLGVNILPPFYYSGQKIKINATVKDVFGRSDIPEAKCDWTLTRNDTLDTFNGQGSSYLLDLKEAVNISALLITLNVSMKAPGNKKFWSSNLSTYLPKTINLQVHDILSNGTLLDYNAFVTRMLYFTNPLNTNEVITAKYADAQSLQYSYFDQGDNYTRPKDEQPMTAINKDPRDISKSYNWVWKHVEKSNGVFGGGVTESNTHQYFAFAFHNPIKQVINNVTNCPNNANCIVYINGTEPTEDVEYEAGWYQVIVKLVSETPIPSGSGFSISFKAYSLVINDAIMDVAPYEPQTSTTTTTTTLSTSTPSVISTASVTSTFSSSSTPSGNLTTTSPAEHKGDNSKSNKRRTTGIIVGCIVGVIVLIGLIVLTVFLLKRRAGSEKVRSYA